MDILSRIKNKVLSIVKKQFYFRMEELYYTLNLERSYPITHMPQGVKVCVGTHEDIEKISERYPEIFGEKKKNRFKYRLESGQRLFLVKMNSKIAAYIWHNFKEATLASEINIPLKQGEAFLYDGHTFSEFRGKGLSNVFISESIKILKREGYNEAHTSHLGNNIISPKVNMKFGFKNTKKYILLRIFGKSIVKTVNVE